MTTMHTGYNSQGGMGGSPSDIYLIFILGLAKEYFTGISSMDKSSLDARTAALIAFVPNTPVRQQIWENYCKLKAENPNASLTASVMAVGDIMEYLSESLELTKESTGSFL